MKYLLNVILNERALNVKRNLYVRWQLDVSRSFRQRLFNNFDSNIECDYGAKFYYANARPYNKYLIIRTSEAAEF